MSTTKSFIDSSGLYNWSTFTLGSDLDYHIDWNEYLAEQNDTFVSMVWDALPTGLTSSYSDDSDNFSTIKLQASAVGNYIITGTMTHVESGNIQKLAIKMHLEVV